MYLSAITRVHQNGRQFRVDFATRLCHRKFDLCCQDMVGRTSIEPGNFYSSTGLGSNSNYCRVRVNAFRSVLYFLHPTTAVSIPTTSHSYPPRAPERNERAKQTGKKDQDRAKGKKKGDRSRKTTKQAVVISQYQPALPTEKWIRQFKNKTKTTTLSTHSQPRPEQLRFEVVAAV